MHVTQILFTIDTFNHNAMNYKIIELSQCDSLIKQCAE